MNGNHCYFIVSVWLPISSNRSFFYVYQDVFHLPKRGSLVVVPFRGTETVGVIEKINLTAITENCHTNVVDEFTGKSISISAIKKVIKPVGITFSTSLLEFIAWVSVYNVATYGDVLRMFIGVARQSYTKVIKYMSAYENDIDGDDNGLLTHEPKLSTSTLLLSKEQQAAFDFMIDDGIFFPKHGVYVLEGITGSGKTEVYLDVVQRILNDGGQVAILLPEILLCSQLHKRFKNRLNNIDVHMWHSDVTPAKKRNIWCDVQTGKVRIVVGARSALFLPYKNLKLIVIDEEHDASFKQDHGVIYNARDMSIVRGKIEKFPVILTSATPSMETVYNVQQKKYKHYRLEKRHGGVVLPHVKIIDMSNITKVVADGNEIKKSKERKILHKDVIIEMQRTINDGKQIMLFLNRRGYAPVSICTHCGARSQCTKCHVPLVYHKNRNILQCHYCGYKKVYTNYCNDCGGKESVISCGYGVEKLEDEIREIFGGDVRMITVTSDTIGSVKKAQDVISKIAEHDVDIIVGTQILAKGLHFKKLHMVVVVDANTHYLGIDVRMLERTYQLLYQVMGRAGRERDRGVVMLQTDEPNNPLLQHLSNYNKDAFIALDLQNRKDADMPPFTKLVSITISGKNEVKLLGWLRKFTAAMPLFAGGCVGDSRCLNDKYLGDSRLFSKLASDREVIGAYGAEDRSVHVVGATPQFSAEVEFRKRSNVCEEISVLGPAPAIISKLDGKFRYKYIINVKKNINVQKFINLWMKNVVIIGGIDVRIDVDPYNFY